MMHRIRRWSFVLGWNLLCIAVVLEVGGRVLHWAEVGTLAMRAASAEDAASAGPYSSGEFRMLLHPFFGYVYGAPTDPNAGRAYYVNNHSFLQDRGYVERHPGCCEYPVTKRAPDEVIIGIFGGSVASGVAITAQHEDLLAHLLATVPAFAGKRIRVLDFAVGAFKQPQQLEVLAYYLSIGQKLDYVVDINGFNEVWFGEDNVQAGVTPSFPSLPWRDLTQFLNEHATRPRANTLLAAYHAVVARDWERAARECRFGACYLVARAAAAWHRHLAATPVPAQRDPLERTFFTIYRAQGPRDAGFDEIADNWAASEALMHRMLAAQSIPFAVMLQPSRWYRPEAPLPAVGAQANPKFARSVPAGYRALVARFPRLRADGISIIDETSLFDHFGNEIYSDEAHFVDNGNRLLVAEVAKWLTEVGSIRH